MRNGITKGYLTHIIKDESTKGYNDLKNILLDEKKEVPLRFEKIRGILCAVDEKGELLWNKGNAVRNKRIHYQKFIEKIKPDLWKEINEINLIHKYREKENRQGHSNKKQSYWAIGYETLDQFYKNSDAITVLNYKMIHNNCCGLTKKGNKSLKEEKKQLRKERRKKFRQEKKGKKKEDGKIDMEEEEDENEDNKSNEGDKIAEKLIGKKLKRRKGRKGKKK